MTTPRQRRNPLDATGAQRDQLAKEHAEEQARRTEELGMATAAAQAVSSEVTDYTQENQPGSDPEAVIVGDAPEIIVNEDKGVVIRVNTDLEDVTVGAGNNYTFKEGQNYKVPLHVANHLEEKGFIYH